MAVTRRALLAAVCTLVVVRHRAEAQPASPTAPIAALDTALIAVMKAGDSAPFVSRYQMLAPAIDQAFDLPRIIAVSVGSYWNSLPQAQQQKLQEVFRSFIIANYVSNFHSYSGEVAAIGPATRAVGAEQVVTSTMTKPSGDVLRIDYVMGQARGAWLVQDILLDGTISRVAVQRSDFTALLTQGNASRLIDSLEQKVSTLSGGAISA